MHLGYESSIPRTTPQANDPKRATLSTVAGIHFDCDAAPEPALDLREVFVVLFPALYPQRIIIIDNKFQGRLYCY